MCLSQQSIHLIMWMNAYFCESNNRIKYDTSAWQHFSSIQIRVMCWLYSYFAIHINNQKACVLIGASSDDTIAFTSTSVFLLLSRSFTSRRGSFDWSCMLEECSADPLRWRETWSITVEIWWLSIERPIDYRTGQHIKGNQSRLWQKWC